MADIEQQGMELERAIARRIREKRQDRGWTLDRLAQVTGLSKGYLSQIENRDKNPPIGTLTKIAYGLGVSVMALVGGEESTPDNPHFTLVRADQRRAITHTEAAPGSGYEAVIFDVPDRLMDSYIVTVSHSYPEKPMIHQGEELVFTLEGVHEFFYDGRTHVVRAGDTMYFRSDRPHMGRSLSEKPARVLVVYCNPRG